MIRRGGWTLAPFGPVWPCLLLRSRLEMRPGWPWLASSGVARSGETFNSVAFGCIQLHFPFSEPSSSEALRRQEPRTQPFLPSAPCALRCRARWIPAFAGMTAGFAGTTHVTNVRVGAAMGQWAVVVGFGVGRTFGWCEVRAVRERPLHQTGDGMRGLGSQTKCNIRLRCCHGIHTGHH